MKEIKEGSKGLVNILKKDIALLLKKHSDLISKDGVERNMGQAINIMKDVDIALRQLSNIVHLEANYGLDFSLDVENDNGDNHMLNWYNILEFFIKNDIPQIIQLPYEEQEDQLKHRATGKTYTLVRLSHDYNIPIFVGSSGHQISILRDRAKELNLKDITIVDNNTIHSKQYSNKKLFLVDEVTDLNKLDLGLLRKAKYKFIGFQINRE